MTPSETPTGPAERLDSWKAIAQYLGRDRTTVMRWEQQAGLPVRRVAGTRGRSVFAYKSEIDQWLAGHPNGAAPPAPEPATDSAIEIAAPGGQPGRRQRLRQLLVVISVVLVLAAGISFLFGWSVSHPVATASVLGNRIVAFDGGGRPLWEHQLPRFDGAIRTSGIEIADLDDDGQPEVVAALHFSLRNGGEGYGQVLVLDGKGQTRWERALDDHFRFGDVDYGPGWFPDDILVYRSDRQVRVAVAAHHHTWWPAVVATYDRDGDAVGQFVNTGWVSRLNATADGRHLLAAGVNNSFGGASLAVLDGKSPGGTSPSEQGTLPACATCLAGELLQRYFVAPWTDLARPSEMSYAGVVQIMPDGSIEWRAAQRAPERGKAPEVIVTLSPRFEIVERTVDDYFVETHALLERAGQIPRTPADWRRPPVREWTPGHGWREIR